MRNLTIHVGTLEVLDRLPSSKYGNPRFLCRVAGFTCRTQPDSMLAYGICNFDGKRVTAKIGTYYGKATIYSIKAV